MRSVGDSLADRLLVGGGGGGASMGGGGNGGGAVRGDGGNSATAAPDAIGQGGIGGVNDCTGGGAGTLSGPGVGGHGHTLPGPDLDCGFGADGSGANGGSGGRAGAGGGGYFGGGGGSAVLFIGSGGGGGSDYPNPASPPTGTSNVTVTDGVQSGNGQVTISYSTAPTPASVCALTLQYADGSAKYQALSAKQKQALDKTITALCAATIGQIKQGTSAAKKKLLVTAYKVGTKVLAAGGYLTTAQVTELAGLADQL